MKHKKNCLVFIVFYLIGSLFLLPANKAFKKMENVSIMMSDGIYLRADIYLPEEEGPHPTILVRNPYNKKGLSYFGERFES